MPRASGTGRLSSSTQRGRDSGRQDREYLGGRGQVAPALPHPGDAVPPLFYKVLDEEEERQWNTLFDEVILG